MESEAAAKFAPTTVASLLAWSPTAPCGNANRGPPLLPGEIGAVLWKTIRPSICSVPAITPRLSFRELLPRGKPTAATSSPMAMGSSLMGSTFSAAPCDARN